MNTSPKNITKTLLTTLLIVAVGALAYFGTQQFSPAKLRGDVIGVAGVNLDPLLSGQACFTGTDATLSVTPIAGETFDWSVTPAANVLSAGGGAPASHLEGVGNEIRFTRPAADDPNAATSYIVSVILSGVLPGTGGDQFTVTIGAPCVTAIEFVNPSGTASPVNGAIPINSVRATLSDGQTVSYDASQIPHLGLQFVAIPQGADPATASPVAGVQFVANPTPHIQLPFEHPAVDIYMSVRGNALAPVVFGQNNAVARGTAPNTTHYILASDEVDPASVTVLRDTDGNGAPDTIVEEGDYVFHDVPHDADPATNDWIEYTRVGPPLNLYIAYLYRPSDAVLWSHPLTVGAIACNLLNANIFEGRGQGFAIPQEGVTPAQGSHSAAFDFGGTTPVTSIILVSNTLESPNSPFGAAVFELQFNFVSGLSSRAQLMNHSGTHYEVNVRDEGVGHEQATASNFAYAVNTTLGVASPFVAYLNPAENNQVILYSLEVGTHTNAYDCSINGAGVAGVCFSDGFAATLADETAAGIQDIDPPRPLDPVIPQGETRVVYSRGGISSLTWRSSDTSIMSVAPLSQAAASETPLGNESVTLNAGTANPANFALPAPGTTILTTSNCVYDTATPPALTSCTVTAAVPVTFNPDPAGYPISIAPHHGSLISGTVQGRPVSTILNASGPIDAHGGGIIPLTGQLTLPVSGDASGTIQLTMNLSLTISPFDVAGTINSHWTLAATGALSKVSLLPTNPNPSADSTATVTNFAVLTAKRPGRAQLFVTDTLGCTAPLDIQVLGQKLFIDYENPTQGQFIEQGDSIQLRAWTGSRGSVNADNDVTNRATWVSDNSAVLTVSPSGRVTALAPGVANITATLSTTATAPETGTLTSEGHLRIHVDQIHGLTISLDSASLNRLPAAERNAAYHSVAVVVQSPHAAGRSITLEGQTIPVTLPIPSVPYTSELDQIRGIASALNTALAAVPGIGVTADSTLPGVLILAATGTNQVIDISTTALPEELSILPAFTGGLTLPPSDTYRMIVSAEYDSGRTRLLNPANVTWTATPVNVLDDTGLETGLLKRGESAGGTANVSAKFENPDHTVKTSNTIPVHIEQGPVIDFVRRVGSGAIEKGTHADLDLRVRDIDTVADIQDITVSIVRSSATTYEGINADAAATWFTAYHYPDTTVATPPPAPVAPPVGGAAGGTGTGSGTGTGTGTGSGSAPAAAPLYRNYIIPVQIPQDTNLTDGTYRLVFTISDRAGHDAHFVLPNFRLGPVALGDVNGDGRVNMIDVILAFRIANGSLTPTDAQTQAANLDGFGNVTMLDVILLFMQVNSGNA